MSVSLLSDFIAKTNKKTTFCAEQLIGMRKKKFLFEIRVIEILWNTHVPLLFLWGYCFYTTVARLYHETDFVESDG